METIRSIHSISYTGTQKDRRSWELELTSQTIKYKDEILKLIEHYSTFAKEMDAHFVDLITKNADHNLDKGFSLIVKPWFKMNSSFDGVIDVVIILMPG